MRPATPHEATSKRPATPKIAWVAPPEASVTSSGKAVPADAIDVLARILSMGRLHHAFTATGSIALAVGAEVALGRGRWRVQKCMMSRSARRLMRGVVFVAGHDV